MGQSTDGILFYGFHAEDYDELYGRGDEESEDEEESDDDADWEDVFAAKKGTPPPAVEYEGNEGLFSAYWDAKHKLVEAEPCEVDTHCHCDEPMPFVCVKASKLTARRGYPEEVTSLAVGAEWGAQLKAFCELMGIPWREPKWWLVSNWC